MGKVRQKCPGCGKLIEVSRNPEDKGWQVTWQMSSSQHRIAQLDSGKLFMDCSRGFVFAVPLPQIEPDDADHPEEHETWLEYHDRLVKEYYDVDAEWALVKEICPELDRPEPAPKPVRPRIVVKSRIYLATVGLNLALVIMNTFLDNMVLVALWTAALFLNLYSAVKIERR